jgi:hypothetical protein
MVAYATPTGISPMLLLELSERAAASKKWFLQTFEGPPSVYGFQLAPMNAGNTRRNALKNI